MLEKQLRTEVVSVNEELIEVRRNKARLEDEQISLKAANDALVNQRISLTGQVTQLNEEALKAGKEAELTAQANRTLSDKQAELTNSLAQLELQRSKLAQEVEQLRSDREAYAKATGTTVAAKVAAMGLYELAMQHYIAEVCSRFGEHRKWMENNRRFLKVEAEWEKQPFEQKYSDNNALFKEYLSLQNLALNKPEIWLGEPTKPVLSPGNEQAVIGEFMATYLNTEDFQKLNKYLLGRLFDRTVEGRGAKALTGRELIDRMKGYEFLDQLLPEERTALNNTLDQFLVSNPGLAGIQINVVFATEPKGDEIIRVGRKVLPDIERFQEALKSYLTQKEIPLPVLQTDVGAP